MCVICIDSVDIDSILSTVSTYIDTMLSMSTLLIQSMKVCNVFFAIYVDTADAKH